MSKKTITYSLLIGLTILSSMLISKFFPDAPILAHFAAGGIIGWFAPDWIRKFIER